MTAERVRVAIVGLGFGAEFIPLYQDHPDAELVAICRRDADELEWTANRFGVPRRYTDYDEMLHDPDIDAVHINTPIPDHAAHTIAALEAGMHVACTVPMATTVEDCHAIVAAVRRSGRTYMMMETAVYTREYLHLVKLRDEGAIGRIQFARGTHYQDMTGWPAYWNGLPPMHYATHAVAPVLSLIGGRAHSVTCFGSGRIDHALRMAHGSPFSFEVALIEVEGTDATAEVSRFLYGASHEYIEGLDVFGSLASFRWAATDRSRHQLHVDDVAIDVDIPDAAQLLPEGLRRYTRSGVYGEQDSHRSYIQGNGHGGSHPHLVHEFISSIIEGRRSTIDEAVAANWTSVGLVAHQSAMSGGARLAIPKF